MRLITLVFISALAACSSTRETPCVEYAAEAAVTSLKICYQQIKENADEAQKSRPQRAEAYVQTDAG